MNLDRIIAVRNNKTLYRDSDRCLKVFCDGYSKADVLNEALNQSRMEEAGLNVPKILEVTSIDGKWTIVSEFISGKTLSQLIKAEPEKTEDYMCLFIELQKELSLKTCPGLSMLKDKMNYRICNTELPATVRFDLHTKLNNMPEHSKVCHGDFYPTNIIISDKDNKPYFLDWSHAALGNASADAARTYILFIANGREDLAKIYLDLYCKKIGTDLNYLNKWIPIVAASLSSTANSEEKKTLLSMVKY